MRLTMVGANDDDGTGMNSAAGPGGTDDACYVFNLQCLSSLARTRMAFEQKRVQIVVFMTGINWMFIFKYVLLIYSLSRVSYL